MNVDEIDGRVLRPLRSAGLVQISGSRVEATAEGQRHTRKAPTRLPSQPRLNETQEELLRLVLRTDSVSAEELDGRVARALLARGLVTLQGGIVTATSAGRTYFDERQPATRRPGRSRRSAENPRAAAIRRAAQMLKSVVPPGAEVLVGNIMAAADDVVDAFRRHARKLDNGRSG